MHFHRRRNRSVPTGLGGLVLGLALLALASHLLGSTEAQAGPPGRLFRIGTGGSSGVYYPVGKLIAQGLTEDEAGGEGGIPGYIGVAQNSAGSIENAQAVARGDIEAGLVQADVARWAYHGEKVFTGNAETRSLRALASLYPEKLQIVTRRDAGVRSILDFKGKRISIDEAGSGTLAVMQIVLAAHGLSEADFSPVYLKPVFTREKIVKGELQGFAMMAGVPMEAVTQLHEIGLFLVPIASEVASRIHAQVPYLVPGTIEEGTYPGVPETSTIEVYALLVVGAACDDDLAYRATASLWSRRTAALLEAGHLQGRAITLNNALNGVSIPLHSGAERFYREKGLVP